MNELLKNLGYDYIYYPQRDGFDVAYVHLGVYDYFQIYHSTWSYRGSYILATHC